jgi:PAS domain S-box-containing protein
MTESSPPADAGPVSPDAPYKTITAALGIDFLGDSGAAYVADLGGQVLWSNAAFRRFAVGIATEPSQAVFALPWPAEEIAVALTATRRSVARSDRFVIGGTECEISSTHHGAWIGDKLVGLGGNFAETWVPDRSLRQQLGETQERLEDITRLVSDWIWETDADLDVTYVTPRVSEVLGYHPRALIGRNLLELGSFLAEDPSMDVNPFGGSRQRPFRDRAFVMRHADGGDRQFRISGLPVYKPVTGQFFGYRGTARDVTAEAIALGLVAQSRSQLTQAIDSITEGFALFDPNERLILCNANFLGMYPRTAPWIKPGAAGADLILRAMNEGDMLADPTIERSLLLRLKQRAEAGQALEFRLGDGRWIRATDSLTAEGGIVSIRTDITGLKQREQALYEAKEAAETANRAKSEFLANISHELRTPLNAIIGFSELILNEIFGPIGNVQYREYLTDVLDSGRHLLNVINDILDIAKAEAGKLELQLEPTDLAHVTEAVLRLMRERAMRGGLTLVAAVDPAIPIIDADARKLKQILLNLVSNAIKFTPPDGTVTVSAVTDADGDILLQVEDTGIGIAPAEIEVALKPFGQVDGRLNRKYEGTGLGLPLTRAMIELHGGRLTIESTVGHGTTVTAWLPAHLVHPQDQPRVRAAQGD